MDVYVGITPEGVRVRTKDGKGFTEPIEEGLTPNQIQYQGALAAVKRIKARPITLYLDNKLVVNQLRKAKEIKSPVLFQLAQEVWVEAAGGGVEYVWVPRENNKAVI